VLKEKEKLESHIKTYKQQKAEFDAKNTNFMQHYTRHLNEVNKIGSDRQLLGHEKEIFYNLNLMINGAKLVNPAPDDKIIDNVGNNKISLGNITLPTTAAVSCSTNSLYINGLKSMSQKGSLELRKEVMSDISNHKSKNNVLIHIERESVDMQKITEEDINYNSHPDSKDTSNPNKSQIYTSQNDSYQTLVSRIY
jgi:hypothetical protein